MRARVFTSKIDFQRQVLVYQSSRDCEYQREDKYDHFSRYSHEIRAIWMRRPKIDASFLFVAFNLSGTRKPLIIFQ
jgi:hypothetical protein